MPDANAVIDKALRVLIWLLPGLLILLGLVLAISYVDRRPRRKNPNDGDNMHDPS